MCVGVARSDLLPDSHHRRRDGVAWGVTSWDGFAPFVAYSVEALYRSFSMKVISKNCKSAHHAASVEGEGEERRAEESREALKLRKRVGLASGR